MSTDSIEWTMMGFFNDLEDMFVYQCSFCKNMIVVEHEDVLPSECNVCGGTKIEEDQ